MSGCQNILSLHLLESLENILLFLTQEQVRNTLYIIAGLVFLRAFYFESKPCVSGSSFPGLMMIAVCAQAQIGYQTNDKLSSTLSEQFIFVGQVLLSY